MHRLYCPVATADGRIIETGVGVGNDLVDLSRQNGSIIINIEYYKDTDSVRNEVKRIKGKAPLADVIHDQANIHQTVCYIYESQALQALYFANKRLTQFLEEIWGFWNVEDLDFGIMETKTLTEEDNSIALPDGFVFTGIRIRNGDNTWSEVSLTPGQRSFMIESDEPVMVTYKAERG